MTAFTTVRKKLGEKSGGKRPETNLQMPAAVSAENSAPGFTSAAYQDTAKAAAPPIAHKRCRSRGTGRPGRLADAVELGPETAPMFSLFCRNAVACVKFLQQIVIHGGRSRVKLHRPRAQRNNARKPIQSQVDRMQRHQERPLALGGDPG